MASAFLLFSHKLTVEQHAELKTTLNLEDIISLPPVLQELWSCVPPQFTSEELIDRCVKPIVQFLKVTSRLHDYILVQGDFGMTFAVVLWAIQNDRTPIYSTTERKAVEVHNGDGTVVMTHVFRHVQFRRYVSIQEEW